MLPPSYLDQMPDAFVQLWQQVEDEILQDVARRIGKMDAVTPTANWQLWRYQQTEALRNDVVKLLAKYTGKSETAIRRLLLQAATGYGTGAGLCGWNCRHTFFAVFPELGDPPQWTQEQLRELNARDIEWNGKKYTAYEISQMQRARERNVRRWKKRYLAEDAAGLDATDAAVRLKAARQSLAEFAQATGGRVDSARVSVPKFGRSEASRANWAAKGYEKQQKDAIIIENLRTAAKLPKAAVTHLEPTKINVDALTFDDAHINAEREHRVSEEQAKQYIRNAKISVSVWNGQFERYYGTEGAAYVNTIKHEIRTAYSRAEFDENTTALIEEMKKNGILG